MLSLYAAGTSQPFSNLGKPVFYRHARKEIEIFGLLIFLGLLAAGVATATVNVSQDGMHAVNARA
jgi:hypothetical protein